MDVFQGVHNFLDFQRQTDSSTSINVYLAHWYRCWSKKERHRWWCFNQCVLGTMHLLTQEELQNSFLFLVESFHIGDHVKMITSPNKDLKNSYTLTCMPMLEGTKMCHYKEHKEVAKLFKIKSMHLPQLLKFINQNGKLKNINFLILEVSGAIIVMQQF